MKRSFALVALLSSLAAVPLPAVSEKPAPQFRNVTVHDPSVIRVDGTFYVFGSHMAAAKSEDLMTWTQVSENALPGNPLVPNPQEEMKEALEWADSRTFWAPDVVQLKDGKFYMYYCVGRLDAPRAALGIAVADQIEGPYKNLGVILKSGMWGQPSHDGRVYDPNIHPNAVDPHTFFDKEGKLWMVYGSFSGGMFILEMNPETGFPLEGQGYGKRLMGANHSRIEGPYILYSPQTDYYYLFVTFGGLGAEEGYNMRVARSRNPDGPYLDSAGTDMAGVHGPRGSFFDDRAIEPHGVKLAGNYQFLHVEGEPRDESTGYKSPGHNSTYFDTATGKYYNFFHTRFVGRGQIHEVRVHQMLMNEDGWLVMAPHRYAGESIGKYSAEEIAGDYKFINHGKAITADVVESVPVSLANDGSVSGAVSGTWKLAGENRAELRLDGAVYRGVFLRQWDDDNRAWVMTFTALSENGVAAWGSKVAR
jgi:arabinan endo-1,5-alpha-L-arabinosidase